MPKLYIETVGCQMNVLDSELVVGSLRRQGYELTDDAGRRRRDPLQHLLRPRARRGQDLLAPSAGCGTHKQQQPETGHRRPRLHGPEGPGADLRAGAARRPGRRPRPAAPGSGADRRGRSRRRRRSWPSASAARTARRDEVERQLRELRPAPRPVDAADAVPGVSSASRSAATSSAPTASCPASAAPSRAARPSTSSPRPGSSPTEGCKEITLLGQTVNSYTLRRRRAAPRGSRDLLARAARHRRPRADQVRHQLPKDMTDDLLDAVRDLPKVSHVPARAGAERLRTTC